MIPRSARATWRGASIATVEPAAEGMVELVVVPDNWIPHRAGQYYDVRFPGENRVRAFSVVSSPTVTDHLTFGIQVLPQGLVSPRLADAATGDRLEIRGPIGSAFSWAPELPGRLVLIGAGAGITPLVSMYEHAVAAGTEKQPLFIVSAKRPELIFRYDHYRSVLTTRFTASQPRIDREYLRSVLSSGGAVGEGMHVRVCGPGGFIVKTVEHLISIGVPESEIRSEAFV